MTRRRVLLSVLSAAALAALVIFGLGSGGSVAVGRPAPALPRERLSGPPLAASTALGGRHAALITFWASWCSPCAKEAPALERFSQSPPGRGRLLGVDYSDGLSEARAFIGHYGWTFPNLRDAEGRVGNEYRLTGLPTTFVVDGGGRIREVLRGPQDESSLQRALASAERGNFGNR